MARLFSFHHLLAGLIAVLVGYTSSAAIVFQAAASAGATPAQAASWLWALGLGMGVTCIGLSLRFRSPVLTAWSTPGAALLVSGLSGLDMGEAVGAFLFASLLTVLCGISGLFERTLRHLPKALAAAMLAGILLRFCLDVLVSLPRQPWLVGLMLVVFFAGRRRWPRYIVPLALLAGLAAAAAQGLLRLDEVPWRLARPEFIAPVFSLTALAGVGLPLFVVTMVSQNVPGLAVLRANGYATPASPLIVATGITGIVLAPFGGFAFCLAAITAAICMSRDADPDPARRYPAAVWAGVFYLVTGMLGASVAHLFAALPGELVMTIAGLALLGTLGNNLSIALAEDSEREAALLTFLVTASGVAPGGIGSAFWGLLAGLLLIWCQRPSLPR